MNYYKRKRREKNISSSDMARMLGIDYRKYVAIDRGDRKMPANLIDKFNEIINKGKSELKLDVLNHERLINEWFEEMSKHNGEKLKEKMIEFNIFSYKELADLLGCAPCTISGYITKGREASYNFKNRLYTFFDNELNIQDKQTKKEKPVKRKKINLEKDLLDFYKNFDVSKWLFDHKLTYIDFAKMYNIPKSTFFYYSRHKANPTNATIMKVKYAIEDYEEKYLNNKIEVVQKDEETFFREILINKYKNKFENLTMQLEELSEKIKVMQQEKDKIESKRTIYNEIINELQGENL